MSESTGPKTAQQIIRNLHNFNRKERDHLMKFALSNAPESPRVSKALWEQIWPKGDGSKPPSPEQMFVGMDYHLNWLFAALKLTNEYEDNQIPPLKNEWPECLSEEHKPEDHPIQGNQQDIDLLVAFPVKSNVLHLVLIEAKFDTGWGSTQFRSKIQRLKAIKSLTDSYKDLEVQWKLMLASPSNSGPKRGAFAPSSLGKLPDWISEGAGEERAVPHFQFGPSQAYRVKRSRKEEGSPWEVLQTNLRGR